MLSFVAVNILFNVFPIVCGSYVFVFVLLCITLCPFCFCNHLEEEEKANCSSTVLWVSLQCVILVIPGHTHLLFWH